MRIRWLCLLLSGTLSGNVLGDPLSWVSASDPGELLFLPSYEGERIEGRFPEFEVELRMDERDGEPEVLAVRVAVGGADLQDDQANAELRETEWLDAGAHPLARFDSKRITRQAGGYLARGELEIRGVRQPLDLPFGLVREADGLILEGSVQLQRSRWGIGGGEWADDDALAESVELRYRALLRPESTP